MMKWNCELIDTLWNVNVHVKLLVIHPNLRINRYIMECKCDSSADI